VKDQQGYSSSGAPSRDADNREVGATGQERAEENWLPHLFKRAGIPPDASLETIQAGMDALANRAAPLTRRWWKWILLLQGATILIPLAWLRHPPFIPAPWVAAATFLAVVLFLSVNWWLRWRGMQKTWARARLVAEVSRSLLSTKVCPRMPAIESLDVVPALQPLRRISERPPEPAPLSQWRDVYIRNRIDDQLKYFAEKRGEAERQRKQLSRWGTLMMDVALAFAFAGVVVSLSPQGESWRRMLGDFRFEIALGLAGVFAPLILLLVQLLRGVQELNRRTARYAQQEEMLERAKRRLMIAETIDGAMEVVDLVERQLLAEVLEWYFHAETAEHFFFRGKKDLGERKIHVTATHQHSPLFEFLRRSFGITSAAGLFLLRVILGRIPWIVGSGAAALMWIAYHQPSDQASRDQLKPLARLADADGANWIPNSGKLAHGCVIIVHGLYGDIGEAITTSKGWPKLCAKKLTAALGENAPDICIVDWHEAAQTAQFNKLSIDVGLSKQENILTDLAGVRSEAEEVGNLLAFRLAMMILDESHPTILRNQPLHLIGHSAGGFIVTRVAVLLKKFKADPSPLHVTILDTPAPTAEITATLPDLYPADTVDFYVSSVIGARQETFRAADFSRKVYKQVVTPKDSAAPDGNSLQRFFHKLDNTWTEHRYAFEWYMETIDHPEAYSNQGFNRSPFRKAAALSKH
jgi:hypothetical protein